MKKWNLSLGLCSLLILIIGCSRSESLKLGNENVTYNLVGKWKIFLFETKERPSKKERWSAEWNLKKISESKWEDINGQGIFILHGKGLRWIDFRQETHEFLIIESSFGSLNLEDEDHEQYHMIRLKGGEK